MSDLYRYVSSIIMGGEFSFFNHFVKTITVRIYSEECLVLNQLVKHGIGDKSKKNKTKNSLFYLNWFFILKNKIYSYFVYKFMFVFII